MIALEVSICVGVFNICNKGMLLNDLDIVISELVLVMLILCPFNLILVRIFGIFVEIRLSFTVDPNLE